MNSITGIITTLNEEHNIADCIASLQLICNEIIVVDSLSSDKTTAIAESLGAKVYLQSYLGDGIQKNVALQYASNQWVFSLDADERISHELAEEINALDLDTTNYEAYAVKRKNYVGSRWIKACRWYPDYLIRLYRKDKTRFADVKQHASVPSNNKKHLKNAIIHYRYNNIGEVFSKPSRNYSTRGAKILYLQGKKANCFSPILHGSVAFISNYFLRGGIFGGIDGLSLSLAISINSYLKYAKLLEYHRDPKVLAEENFDSVW
ncbi:MAG TPA: glycosyltransferase family 2 protein [Bacteroidales bacterium]|nr:glycosyltransferase family 2 protein [Bacteroidales bacterium]HON20058.1 glycosyltransferase family 2 protein [Bacteroidales bacterium]HOR82332.1 glycosyltransferase family 2 protein [Bacteroidales bacterium]HPJ91582.1 glycosyltransferase family 2 protein [Bacteroidales bacterium]HPX59352.1 glycosyltransferase family 2 protein [Bacteroidales bacterium]